MAQRLKIKVMPSLALLFAGAGSAAALLAGARPSVGLARAATPAMTAIEEGPTFWEAYAKARDAGKLQGGTLEDAKEEFRQVSSCGLGRVWWVALEPIVGLVGPCTCHART